MRAAVAERDAEPLRGTDRDVGTPAAPFTGWREQRQREEVRRGGDERADGVRRRAYRAVVANRAVGGGILDQRADHVACGEVERVGVGENDFDSARGRARANDRDGLRM